MFDLFATLWVYSGYTMGKLWDQYNLSILWVNYGYTMGVLCVYSKEKKVSDEVIWNVSISYPL